MGRIGSGVLVSASFQISSLRILLHSDGGYLRRDFLWGNNFRGEMSPGGYLLEALCFHRVILRLGSDLEPSTIAEVALATQVASLQRSRRHSVIALFVSAGGSFGDRPNLPGQNPPQVITPFFAAVRGSIRVRTPPRKSDRISSTN